MILPKSTTLDQPSFTYSQTKSSPPTVHIETPAHSTSPPMTSNKADFTLLTGLLRLIQIDLNLLTHWTWPDMQHCVLVARS
ncbi:hypothetical protein DPMN_062955 [Dreissena polymorpha]|uniref:Uncharacterized protein n=1 Tax=Dreissena polymorpha TaxID=45954 RepID=A0A9D4HIL5_DREPO|nr:hypothetical protein DPMN_062955 [Dreissena polymorpha]